MADAVVAARGPLAPRPAPPRGTAPGLAGTALVALAVACWLGPWLGALLGIDAQAVDLLARFEPPSLRHPLGTDELGRDLLLRLLEGGQVSLVVGLSGALLASLVGTGIGLVAGYCGGRVDAFLMRFTDAVIALPVLPILILAAAIEPAKLGLPSGGGGAAWRIAGIVLIVGLVGWTTVARLVRAEVRALKAREFITAARALGAGPWRIMMAHLLPNAGTPIIVATTLAIGNVVLTESILSFLGLGIQPPAASWGSMLTGAQDLVFEAPRLAIWPGAMIFLTVLAFNRVGDALRERWDPHPPGFG